MTRLATGQPIVVRASNNVYTVLAGIAAAVALLAVVLVFLKGSQIGFEWFKFQ